MHINFFLIKIVLHSREQLALTTAYTALTTAYTASLALFCQVCANWFCLWRSDATDPGRPRSSVGCPSAGRCRWYWRGRFWVGRDNHGVRRFGSWRTLLYLRTPLRPSVGCGRSGAIASNMCSNTGRTSALYKRNRSRSLTCCVRNERGHMERKAVTASIFRRDRSLVYPSRDPSLLAVLHSSGTRSFSRLMIVRSVLSTLTYRNQSPSAVGAISLILLRYSWSVETKSAYIGSLVRLWSTGGRRGRHPRNVRKAP